LSERRRRLASLVKKISDSQKKMPGLMADHQKSAQNKKNKSLEYEAFQKQRENIESRIAETLRLDTLTQKEEDLGKRQSEKQAETKKNLLISDKEKRLLEDRIKNIKKQISDSQAYLSLNAQDKTIAAILPLIKEKAANLTEIEKKKTTSEHRIKKNSDEKKTALENAKKTIEQSETAEKRLQTKNREQQQISEHLNSVFQGENFYFF
ncbi:hypothetical protein, partial [Nocardia mangyaensis]|uniref:hypothetical protein n=1 Tax=Nocardia mangyaensis TaxID=2213200 RepID=UPI0026757BD7